MRNRILASAILFLSTSLFCGVYSQDSHSLKEDADSAKRQADYYEQQYEKEMIDVNDYENKVDDAKRTLAYDQKNKPGNVGPDENYLDDMESKLRDAQGFAKKYKNEKDHYDSLYEQKNEAYNDAKSNEDAKALQKEQEKSSQANDQETSDSESQGIATAPDTTDTTPTFQDAEPTAVAPEEIDKKTTFVFRNAFGGNNLISIFKINEDGSKTLFALTPSTINLDKGEMTLSVGSGMLAKDFTIKTTGGTQNWHIQDSNPVLFGLGCVFDVIGVIGLVKMAQGNLDVGPIAEALGGCIAGPTLNTFGFANAY